MANAKNSKLKSIFCGIAVALAAVLCLSVPFLLKKGNDDSSGGTTSDVVSPNMLFYKHSMKLNIAASNSYTTFDFYSQDIAEVLTKDTLVEHLNADPDLIKGVYFVTTEPAPAGTYQGYFTSYDKDTGIVNYTRKSGSTGQVPLSYVSSVEDVVSKSSRIPTQDNYYIDRLWTNNGSNFTYKNANVTKFVFRKDNNGNLAFRADSTSVSDIQADITFTLGENIDYSKYDFVRVLFYGGQDPAGGLSFYVGETKLNVFSRSSVDLTSRFTGNLNGKENYYLQIPATLFNGTITIKGYDSNLIWFTPIMAEGIKN